VEVPEPGLRAAWAAGALTWLSRERDPGLPPVVVKDVIDVAGVPTTAGVLPPWRPLAPTDATVVARVRAAGYQVVAKANLQPWAVGASGANHCLGTPAHPHDPDGLPGGSSSGSAVAVALGACGWALGTDTGGSVRVPAACCRVVGFKPTTGRVPLAGVLPLSPSLDCVGVLAADPAQAAAGWRAISGEPPERAPGDPVGAASPRLGAAGPEWTDRLDPAAGAAWRRVSRGLPTVPLPPLRELRRVGHGILAYEAVRSFADRRDALAAGGRTADVDALLRAGGAIDGADYRSWLRRRPALQAAIDDALATLDALVVPTLPVIRPRWAARPSDARLTTYTVPFNLSGHPVITIPVQGGRSPISLQLVGRRGGDRHLLRLAETVGSALGGSHEGARTPMDSTTTRQRRERNDR
jgi:Asp-tRNA(Asn)/Glu-tRNA(Gln) amidotransferase A subunit family amidase